jgi:hypothetical protein
MMHYLQAIKNALAKGYTVSVHDGEEWQVKRSTDYAAIVEAAQSVEQAVLRILDAQTGDLIGNIDIIGYQDPRLAVAEGYDDSILDYSDNALIREIVPA